MQVVCESKHFPSKVLAGFAGYTIFFYHSQKKGRRLITGALAEKIVKHQQ
jgi:hypothetical protein